MLLLPGAPAVLLKLPDADRVAQFWGAWLESLAHRRGIDPADITPEMALSVIQPTLEMNTENVAMAGPQMILKAIASGNIGVASRAIREFLLEGARQHKLRSEYAANRRRQSERARKPRGGLTGVIRPWIAKKPNISIEEVLTRLKVLEANDHEVIREVTDEVIRVAKRKRGNGEVIEDIKISSLAAIIGRERKKWRTAFNLSRLR